VEIILLFVLPLVITVLVYKISIKDLGFRSNLHNLIIALCLGFVYGSVNFLLVGFRELTAIPSSFYLIFETHVFQNAIPLTIAICLVAIALPEEFFFRSIIQSNLTERFGAIRGILLASLCFGFFHIPANLTAFMFIGFDLSTAFLGSIAISFIAQAQIGIILGVAWYRTRSLLLPVSIHTAHNVAEIFPLIMSMMLWGF